MEIGIGRLDMGPRRVYAFYMKIRPKHRRDFSTYYAWAHRDPFRRPPSEEALPSFAVHESTGKHVPSGDPDTLAVVMQGKANLNLHIKMWAEGVSERLFAIGDIKEDFEWLPSWVWRAVQGQVKLPPNAVALMSDRESEDFGVPKTLL